MNTLRAYYALVKPGVMYGNVLTGAAGYLFAAGHFGRFDWVECIATIIGMTGVVSAACVLNNYLDQDIDQVMQRTKKRPSVTGEVSGVAMITYSVVLLILGTGILALWTNWLVVALGLIGFVTYVWLYGAWSKRRSLHGTTMGSISGAFPIAGGYAAVSGSVDLGLVVLFLILFFWQFPEFYSISIYRRKEYKAANVPVISVVRGIPTTIRWILVNTILYVTCTLALTPLGYTGWLYFFVMACAGFGWIRIGIQGLSAKNPEEWARTRMFRQAMYQILLLCVMLSIGPLLP
ncbi:MAG: heme o synthase [Candidatus Saccharimonadales bacterium]